MTKVHITLKDIARVAGVSTATASLALSGDPRVNIKTKKSVEEVAKRLKYVPNEIGRSLRARKAETIALIFPNTPHNAFSHPYFVQLLEGITEVLVENSFHLLLSTSPTELDESAAYDKILRNRRADGIILWPASIKDRNILKIIESGFPLVYLGKWLHDDVMTVERDEFGGAYKVTSHLLQLGRKRIVHITGPLEYQVSINRLDGYKQALQDNKILYDSSLVIEKDFSLEAGTNAVAELRGRNVEFDGIFAGNDLMAIGAMKGLQKLGISVPRDVSIVGCDNIEMANLTNPALTTIDQSIRQVGKIAAEKMIAFLGSTKGQENQTIVPAQLIVRESCGAGEEG
ncbi:LacI family DNA-binding transcriptional regulator [Cohnella sp.]|uniref:LacI family DNA-binding transcriptional regulator n=1 Tax=Cohnella sp. TaxID=1883426 RepID=UPI00356B022F